MKICLVANMPRSVRDISSFTNVWAWYLPPSLRRLGVDVHVIPFAKDMVRHFAEVDLGDADHVLAANIWFFRTAPRECVEVLRRRLPGATAQLADASLLGGGGCDLTFTFRNCDELYPPGAPDGKHELHHAYNRHVGWAADPELCRPAQDDRTLRILVDHPTFKEGRPDRSLDLLLELRSLARSGIWKGRYDRISVRQLVDGAVRDVDLENITVSPYNRVAVPYLDLCAEYSQAHIFCVSHEETLGLSALEAATAGALVLLPDRFIPFDRLPTIHHSVWRKTIDWAQVLGLIDIPRAREKAMRNSWDAVAGRIAEHLAAFRRP